MSITYFKNKYKIDSTRLKYWNYGNPGYYFVTICIKGMVQNFGKIKNEIMCLSDIGSLAHNYWLEIPQHFPFVELHEFVVMPNHMHGVIFIGDNKKFVETRFIASPYNVPNHTKIKYDNKNTNNGDEAGEMCGKNETRVFNVETRFIASPVHHQPAFPCNHHTPVNNHHTPVNNHHTPVNNHHTPIDNHHKPDYHGGINLENNICSVSNVRCTEGDAINRVSTGGSITGKHNPMGKQTLGEIIRWYKGRCSYEINQNLKTQNYFIWQPRFHDHLIRNEYEMNRIQEYIINNPANWEKDIFYS